jgi:ferredoxin
MSRSVAYEVMKELLQWKVKRKACTRCDALMDRCNERDREKQESQEMRTREMCGSDRERCVQFRVKTIDIQTSQGHTGTGTCSIISIA